MATGTNLATEVRRILHDEDDSVYRWSDAELVDYINAGQRRIATLVPESNAIEESVEITNNIARQVIPAGGIKFIRAANNMSVVLGETEDFDAYSEDAIVSPATLGTFVYTSPDAFTFEITNGLAPAGENMTLQASGEFFNVPDLTIKREDEQSFILSSVEVQFPNDGSTASGSLDVLGFLAADPADLDAPDFTHTFTWDNTNEPNSVPRAITIDFGAAIKSFALANSVNGGGTLVVTEIVTSDVSDRKGPIRYVEKDVLDTINPTWEYDTEVKTDSENFFEHYCHDSRQPRVFYLYPAPPADSKYISIVFTDNPTELTALGETLALGDEYYEGLVEYVVYRALTKEGRESIPSSYRQELYNNFLQALGLKRNSDSFVNAADNAPPEGE